MTTAVATRGAQKLQAALAELGLQAAIRGKRAIDIGASTGGFTATLLEHGAVAVAAIDVGHGQLMESLRSDPRVAVIERTDFRRASLDIAPGPFEIFSVDVSFVAARNMLRSLAFRLAPGAQGMVLVKPQFELSKGELRSGSVADPALRKRAVERFTQRAERCGFRIVQVRDSSVPGESGTVELFAHLVFEGRPESFPSKEGTEEGAAAQPKEARVAAAGRRPRAVGDGLAIEHEWFAIAAPGLEGLLAEELGALAGLNDVKALAGGVAFRGDLRAGYAANLSSRLATRVLVRVGKLKAREFALLRRSMHALPFERFIPVVDGAATLRVFVTAHHCRLYHTKALAEIVELAVADRLRVPVKRFEAASDDEDDARDAVESAGFGREPYSRVLLRGQDDEFAVSVDSSGVLLHRRGGRPEAGAAPLRETLAAAVLRAVGYTGEQPFVDAMCGSGTLALEAAQVAAGLLPGAQRAFALEAFVGVSSQQLADIKAQLIEGARRTPPAPIAAFDRDRSSIAIAQRNAARTGVDAYMRFEAIDLRDAQPPAASGILVANPPYGRRLGRREDNAVRYRAIGHALRARWQGWRIALLVPRGTSEAWLGLRVEKRVALMNGGVPVVLVIGTPER